MLAHLEHHVVTHQSSSDLQQYWLKLPSVGWVHANARPSQRLQCHGGQVYIHQLKGDKSGRGRHNLSDHPLDLFLPALW